MEPAASGDIQLDAFGTGNGSDVVQVAYTLSGTGGAAFDLGFYTSTDALFDGGDTWLSSYSITDPAALTDGGHTLDLTLGTDIDVVNDAMPVLTDHYVLAVADPAGAIAETDETNNVGPFAGVYQYDPGPLPGQTSVFVHGTEAADLLVVSPTGSVDINGALSGPHDQIYAFMIYSHGGADALELGQTPYGAYSGSWAGPGDDVLKMSPWAGHVDGGDGVDTLNARHFSTQIQVDLAAGTAGWATGNAPVLGYENVVGTPFDDTLNGDGGDNMLDGQGGVDTIRGFGGNDMILGGTGYDHLWGGDGDDTVRAQADGGQVWGDAGNDSIRGSDVADALSGGPGDDDIWPGLGLDTIRGDAGVDTVDFFHPTAAGGVQVYLDQTTATDQEGNLESIKGVENVLGTPYPDELTGDWNPNFLFGRAGDDVIYGMSGNDVLWGGLSSIDGQGGDYLDGGAGDDALYGNDDTCTDDGSPDQIVGSVGTDTGYGTALDVFWPSTETIIPCP
jgi:Ca2+-binding RTX toxin-like protein